MSYEAAMSELQEIVARLQDGRTGIDDLEKELTRASQLIQWCREKLRDTEAAADQLLGNS
ncbi:MAG TPA: exodeoxyribonuclease VII small subunit [Saprospiraceae bacterium]|nr:exodeoxyribonuclease VII small subunit [Saprospiraceae bacterium]HMQ82066.1 exodeoxyribonuclease VII small subunit [Saprospiraceae bacterium]